MSSGNNARRIATALWPTFPWYRHCLAMPPGGQNSRAVDNSVSATSHHARQISLADSRACTRGVVAMTAGRHEVPRPNDPFMAAVLLALAILLTVVVVLAIVAPP